MKCPKCKNIQDGTQCQVNNNMDVPNEMYKCSIQMIILTLLLLSNNFAKNVNATEFNISTDNSPNIKCDLLFMDKESVQCESKTGLSVEFPRKELKTITVIMNERQYDISPTTDEGYNKLSTTVNNLTNNKKQFYDDKKRLSIELQRQNLENERKGVKTDNSTTSNFSTYRSAVYNKNKTQNIDKDAATRNLEHLTRNIAQKRITHIQESKNKVIIHEGSFDANSSDYHSH